MLALYGWRRKPHPSSPSGTSVASGPTFEGSISERGKLRNDVRPRMRAVGFEGRLTIAFRVTPDQVFVLGVFRACQDWELLAQDR